jgi:PKD repeat protein
MLNTIASRRPAALGLALALLVTGLAPGLFSGAAPEPIAVRADESTRSVDGQAVFDLAVGTSHIAIHWRGHHDARLTAAFSEDGSTFGEPQDVAHDEFGERTTDGRTYGAVMIVNGARAVRVTADQPLEDVTVLAMDAGRDVGPSVGFGTTVAGLTAPPGIITRAGWAADETIRFQPDGEEAWWSQYFPLQKLVVHHTAGSNYDPNPSATVRAIYRYHAVTQGWGDIGYNYLIDSAGRIYEGRHSRDYWYGAQPTSDDGDGNVIAGGHALYHNAGTMGIALMGTFTSVAPTSAARSSLVTLLTWAADEYDINPTGATTYQNPVNGYTRTTHNIAGHRDYNQTGCPGQALYNLLPSIRSAVAAAINTWSGETFNPTRNVSIAAGYHIGYQFNAAGGVTGTKAFTLSSPSSAPANTRATIPAAGSGEWYRITAGIWAGYWLAASSKVVLGPPAATVDHESYRPFAPLYLNPGTYVGYRFNTWGSVTGSRTMVVSSPIWLPVQERSTIPGQSQAWYYVTAGTLSTYWLPESASAGLGTLPTAEFRASQTGGLEPLTVSFTDMSATWGATSWAWDFDSDGSTDSTDRHPTHVFPSAGTYSVSLTVSDSAGTDTMTHTNYVTVRGLQEGTYVPLNPARVLDTRFGTGLSGPFSGGVPRSFAVAGQGGVPTDAIAVTGNLTVTGQTAAGYLYLGPDPVATPSSSTLNFPAGDTRANGVTVALGPDGSLSVTYGASASARTHVVFDVTGYFFDASP